MSHNGLARSIVPVHTSLDGDTIFTVATNAKECDVQLAEVYMPKVLARAVANALLSI
ncbi:hypothetical protein [Aedoeadaptatus coxii]|uniref:hypothetical protein n=1 Tax=Aedoeadaptatus coxii TaxID=755172 RepID=UPI002AA2B29A|nr:hypothetical protein [Peptoniphilus coxii]